MDNQIIYINIDDSGVLTKNEKYCVYAGIVFTSKEEKDHFINLYKNIIKKIQCKYCSNNQDCKNTGCPEIKNTNVKNKHKRRIMNAIKKHHTMCCIINNQNVYESIISRKDSRGRYRDYAQKLMIKQVIIDLINKNKINNHKKVKLIILLDENSTISNGYYNLKETIEEELVHGISNFAYNQRRKPILFGGLDIKISYIDSQKHCCIQAADMIAGTVRDAFVYSENYGEADLKTKFIDTRIFLP